MFYSGYPWQESPRASVPGEARRPAVGSVVSRLRPGAKDIPPYVSIENQPDWERAYYAGVEHEPFRVGGSSPREAMETWAAIATSASSGWTIATVCCTTLDIVRREFELGRHRPQDRRFQQRAHRHHHVQRVRDAFDLDKEPKEVRDRYGEGPFRHGPHPGQVAAAGPPPDRSGRFGGDRRRPQLGHAPRQLLDASRDGCRRWTRRCTRWSPTSTSAACSTTR